MPNGEQTVKPVQAPKTKAKAEPKVKKITLVDIFLPILEAGVKDKETAVKKAMVQCKAKGITASSRGNVIDEARLLNHLTAILRDIKQPRKGWWSNYEIVEKEGELLQLKKK